MGKIYKRNCNYCGKYYEREGEFCCSLNCSNKYRGENDLEWRIKNREHMRRILANPTEKMKKYRNELKIHPSRIGVKLSKETKRKISEKAKINFRGTGNPNYRGDKAITPLLINIRNTIKYKEWRNTVFIRDDYICILCGRRSRKGDHVDLEADHIIAFAKLFYKFGIKTLEEAYNCKELWDINNGRTLCKECHKKTPTHGYKIRYDIRNNNNNYRT